MLIRFGVGNYGSIRDYQEISLVASSLKESEGEGLIPGNLPGLAGLNYLRGMVLYGANAAGKSTVLRALKSLRDIVLDSYGRGSLAALPYAPFALDSSFGAKPTDYFIEFVNEGVRFCYELSHLGKTIVSERLEAYPKGRAQVWFTRDSEGIRGSEYVSVPKAALPLINDNTPILSFLANYPNLPAHDKIAPAYRWFADGLIYLNRGPSGANEIPFSGEIIDGNTGSDFARSYIRMMVRAADLGISDVNVIRRKISPEDRTTISRVSNIPIENVPEVVKEVVFEHRGPNGGTATLGMGEESDGTKRIFDLSGFMAVALERGATIVVDELDASLHPTLLASFVRGFQNAESNPKGAQLVFSAHNTSLLNRGTLRRDQIWFARKVDGATELYPLTDYRPRRGEALEQGYLAGRYSAVPVIPDRFGGDEG